MHRAPNTPEPEKPKPLRRPGQTEPVTGAKTLRLRDMVKLMKKKGGRPR